MIELTIKRPNGEFEKVKTDKFGFSLSKPLFDKIRTATKNAGKGDVLSWSTVDNRTEEEKAHHDILSKIGKLESQIAAAHRTNNAYLVCKLEKEIEALKNGGKK